MTTSALTETYRTRQHQLRAMTLRDALLLWPLLDIKRLDETLPALTAALQALILRDRARSALLAADYLSAAAAAAGTTPVVKLAERAPAELVSTVVRVTSSVSIKTAVGKGTPRAEAAANALVRTSGEVDRLTSDGGRLTVLQSVAADPNAVGWRRITSPSACAFCALLAGRGAVYRETTVGFRSHGHCGCTAEPVFATSNVPA